MTMNGRTTTQGYPDMAEPEFSRPAQSGAFEIRTEAKKELQHAPRAQLLRKKRRVIRLTVVVLLVATFYLVPFMLSDELSRRASAEDYQFGSETVNKGSSGNPANRNSEDAIYNELVEGDQYADTNFSGSSENVVTGATGGGSFPSALDTDDSTRRNYIEANTASTPTYQILRPTSDGSPITLVNFPTSPTTNYDKVDETTVGGNGDTDYNEGVTNGQEDTYGMSDASDPGGSPNIDVTIWHISDDEGATSNLQVGIDIGGTNYIGWQGDLNSGVYTNYSYEWVLNPSTSAEWTLTQVNALNTFVAVTDANPDTRTTQVALRIEFNPTVTYQLDAQITYSSVTSTSQTTGFQVLAQGYRNGDTESIKVQAWNYTSSAWVDKVTVSTGSDADYNFNLLGWGTNCERSSGNVVLLRLLDASGGDATQTTTYLDLLKVKRIEQGYALDIEMTASSTNQYGEQRLRIKGFTSAESFYVDVYNNTAVGWDTQAITITATSNTWHTFELYEPAHRSGSQQIRIRFVDAIAYTSDTTKDTMYLDVTWVSWTHTDPTLSQDGCNGPKNVGQTVDFWVIFIDVDNEAATYVRVNIAGVDYNCLENSTGDTTTVDGKGFYYQKSDIPGGTHDYFFKAKDANSGEITTTTKQVTVNRIPSLSLDGVLPAIGNNGDWFSFYALYTDLDNNAPSYIYAVIDSLDYAMVKNQTDDDYTDGCAYHYDKQMSGGDHTYYFRTADYLSANVQTTSKNLDVNNKPSLSGFTREPSDPCYPTTTVYFNVTFTDVDDELPSAIKWRESGGSVQNVSMSEVDPGDLHTNDGKTYTVTRILSHGLHEYDYYATDGYTGSHAIGGSNSITIQNRAPTIDNKIVDDHEWRNVYWEWDYAYTDLDGDTIIFQLSANASFLNINSASGLVYGTTSDPVAWYSAQIWCNDSYGGSDSDSFILYVDNRAPIITNGPGSNPATYRNTVWYYNFDYSDADGDSIGWARSGETWLTIASDGNLTGTTPDTPGDYPFTVYCNDSYGGSANYPFTLHVNNRIPVITSSGNTTQTEGTYLAYHILATDDDGDVLTYELSTNASWASISGEWVNGTATGVGWYNFQIWCNDSYSGSDSKSWQLTVIPANEGPYFTSTPIYSVANNSAYLYDANATDPNEDPITYGLSTNCPNLEINPSTGVVSGSPNKAGTYYSNVTASDGINPPAFQNHTLYVTSAPPSFTNSGGMTCQHNVSYYYDANADDPEDEILVFNLEGNSTAFLTIVPSTGVVSGTPPAVGWWFLNISVSDYTNIIWLNQTLYGLNQQPTITSNPVTQGTKGVQYVYDVNATDMNSDHLHYSLYEAPSWMFIDLHSGLIEGTPNEDEEYQIRVRVWDGWAYSWQNHTLNVGNSPPYWTSTPGTDGEVGELFVYLANAFDEEGNPITYIIVSAPPEFSINETTGLFQGIPRFHGDITISLQAFDGYSYIWQNFTISVEDPPASGSDGQTVDDANVLLWVALIALGSIAVGASLVIIKRRRPKKRKKR